MTDSISIEKLLERVEELNDIGVSLSREDNTSALLEKILLGAKKLTNADAGTIYLMDKEKQHLCFETVRTDKLNIALGGTTGNPITFPPVPIYDNEGSPNLKNIVTYSASTEKTVNIEDAYHAEGFDFSGTRKFDESTGYHSQSFLTIPLKNHEKEVIGVLQLINSLEDNGDIGIFTHSDQQLAESLASQAAVTLTNKRLIQEQKELFEDFIQLTARAIDEKSPYTGGHCSRVPVLALMTADALNASSYGNLKDFKLTDDEMYELKIGAWLHDCGKVTTPEYVMDKATKLGGLFDRIEHVDLRMHIVKMTKEIELLRAALADHPEAMAKVAEEYAVYAAKVDDDNSFLKRINIGGEFMPEEEQQRVDDIANSYTWTAGDIKDHPVLYDTEIENLKISRGTLNDDERLIINNHVSVTLKMLNSLHYPKTLLNVPDIAASHHEKMDGTGYPRQLKGEDMLVQSRIVAIADVFEALTAADRPYKKWKTLSESLRILGFMARDGHVDPDLFDIFVREKVYLKYAEEHLKPHQIDEIDESKIPGYEP